jgi:hypothetical protein
MMRCGWTRCGLTSPRRPLVVENTVNRMRKVNRLKRPRFRVAPWGNARGDGLALGRWGVIGVSHGA